MSTEDARERPWPAHTKLALMLALWAGFAACIAFLSLTYQETWRTYFSSFRAECSGPDLTTSQWIVWGIATGIAGVLLAFLTNRWVGVALALAALVVFWGFGWGLAFAALMTSCEATPTAANPNALGFSVFFASGSVAVGILLAIPIWLGQAAFNSYRRMRRRRTSREIGILALLLVAAAVVPAAVGALGWAVLTDDWMHGLSIVFLFLAVVVFELAGLATGAIHLSRKAG